jgi:hypothetical protein
MLLKAIPSASCRQAFEAAPAPSRVNRDLRKLIFVRENAIVISSIERRVFAAIPSPSIRRGWKIT